jgi:transcription-repair coupling factor (superfamily II helicase)
MGDIVRSINAALENDTIPWVRLEDTGFAPAVLDLIADIAKKQVAGYILRDDAEINSISNDDLEVVDTSGVWIIAPGASYAETMKKLEKTGWRRVKRVWEAGEYSVIGESVTAWPAGFTAPVRLEFEGEKIERIGKLDIETWRISSILESVVVQLRAGKVGGDRKNNIGGGEKEKKCYRVFDAAVAGVEHGRTGLISVIIADTAIIPSEIADRVTVVGVDIRTTHWQEGLVRTRLDGGWSVWMVVSRHREKWDDIEERVEGVEFVEDYIERGFEIPDARLMVLSDHELWGTVRLSHDSGKVRYKDFVLDSISPGDHVVHEDHGIAVYAGVTERKKDDIKRSYIELHYARGDKLFVPFSQLKRVTKYVGVGGAAPRLTRLGGGEWRRVKNRVEKAVENLARELLRLYAVRELADSDSVREDVLQIDEFENDFDYVETEDQIRAVNDIKEDLRSGTPMDRVLVGDVGFGKTEVAMRAAYIMATLGKQVAVLAPTTVLVEQHYRVFRDRFEKHGINVESLSRFLTRGEAEDVVSRLKTAEVDIVIGTHRLLSDDISFKDLGMVIIDEEQKFGVSQKEKLKGLRVDTHVLSMSATPIPRTLNMALSGVRDISIIATPPEGRLPIENSIRKFDWDIVADAIGKEVSRGGQVYFVHNRVSTLPVIRKKLTELLPDVRIVMGHGQMAGSQLSKVMRGFHEGTYDVLLCTTIIENGLDMPNVNTLIVDGAEYYGLSQLYQIRGRIGRGDNQACAYFLYGGMVGGRFVRKGMEERVRAAKEGRLDPEEHVVKDTGKDDGRLSSDALWSSARSRLDAIKQLQSLGSGFALAQRDLEIRGAGNFLGREQHGNVSAIGFSLYCRLLEMKVEEMKKKQDVK